MDGVEQEVSNTVQNAIDHLKTLGAKVVNVSCPSFRYGLPAYYVIAPAEASSNLARYDAVKYGLREQSDTLLDMYTNTRTEGLGAEVKRRIMLGTYTLSTGYYDAYYLKAQKVRTLIKEDFNTSFEKVDILVSPTSPTTAFKAGEKISKPLNMYLSDSVSYTHLRAHET